MGPEGLKRISDTLAAAGIGATTVPADLAEGQRAKFITVETPEDVAPSEVLESLLGPETSFHNLGDGSRARSTSDYENPWLKYIHIERGSITFEDTNPDLELNN